MIGLLEVALQQVAEGTGEFPQAHEVDNRHTMITVVQRWLRSLQGGLVDTETAAKVQAALAGGSSVEELMQVFAHNLSLTRREVLCRLFTHWHRIASHSDTNRMDPYATACCVFLMAQSQEAPNMGLLQVFEYVLKHGTVKVMGYVYSTHIRCIYHRGSVK